MSPARGPSIEARLNDVHRRLRACGRCPKVCGPAVHGPALETRVMLVGQAPGVHEASLGRPFAYTAGKTLFKWLRTATGIDEETLREMIYFSAVARCFPGKNPNGAGDRPPSAGEIANCREFLVDEVAALRPRLILAVGRSAIGEVLGPSSFGPRVTLNDVVGRRFRATFHGHEVDVVPLPHPSGVSRWPQTEPGRTLLARALELIGAGVREHCA